ncbi:Uncharacterized membrane-anchored protein YjiN, DUF445 family [Tistlia consotensis]|uniref:Uncharacterized membrane-anchored protein YjiN, DUF445 family n=1 Tax=Tistlia consotensis USBA 355 TaxID=560819 RepID=A0A1Y6BHT2_9PROT|nr:DUF445 domain-containing protein [Tistlia consotensis]SMF12224.1 Uncharacterized membrane-anchored protein YjiN, DUF445 family [Tistlia consotensis USBA 355]SNR51258.1 Uncharacterized membrane-anchored protein YjiN, DUF445 family [Tistlia consotensis]
MPLSSSAPSSPRDPALPTGPANDAAKRRALRRHRFWATFLLVAVGAGFVAALRVPQPGFWVELARAGCEAALVGGLADWFAVTALFRRPLGLPIPHTAVIPNNQARIGEGLGRFVEHNFLQPELIAGKLLHARPAARVADWLAEREHAELIVERIAAAAPVALRSIQDREIRRFVAGALERELRGQDLAPLLGRLLALLREGDRHQELFDQAVGTARRFLADNRERVFRTIADRSRWYVPRTVDRKVAAALIEGADEILAELGAQDHEARRRFDQAVAQWIEELHSAPEARAKVAEWRDRLLANPEMRRYLAGLGGELRERLIAGLENPDSTLRRGLVESLQALARALARDPHMQERFDRRLAEIVRGLVPPFRHEIGGFIAEVVRSWESRTVVERIELAVGRDLQYIRVNGTLVGAAVGCALFLVTHYLV